MEGLGNKRRKGNIEKENKMTRRRNIEKENKMTRRRNKRILRRKIR